MGVVIPKGKTMRISTLQSVKGEDINSRTRLLSNIDLVLEDDVQLTFNTNYKEVVNSSSNTGLSFISQLTKEFKPFGLEVGSDFKELGFKMWEKTDPVSFGATVGLYMKTDAKADVFDPMKELIKLTLPTDLGSSENPGVGLRAPGPTILEALGVTKSSKDLLFIEIGNILLYPAVITKAEPTINTETDNLDYNISAKIRLDIQTIYTATTNLIDKWGYLSNPAG